MNAGRGRHAEEEDGMKTKKNRKQKQKQDEKKTTETKTKYGMASTIRNNLAARHPEIAGFGWGAWRIRTLADRVLDGVLLFGNYHLLDDKGTETRAD